MAARGFVLVLVLTGCGGEWPSAACRDAAAAQAEAEEAYLTVYAAHAVEHAAGSDDHAEYDQRLLTSRIDRILADEATARACR